MFFPNNREEMREFFVRSWKKQQTKTPLEPLEAMIAQVVELHPEYHTFLTSPEAVEKDFTVESGQTNPFLHMGMHITILEQVGTNRPAGIRPAFEKLLAKTGDSHQATHLIMDCLAEALWEAQQNQSLPDETGYLLAVKRLAE